MNLRSFNLALSLRERYSKSVHHVGIQFGRGVILAIVTLLVAEASVSHVFAADNAGIEEAVRQSFADIPVMIPIAKCESGFRMFDGDAALDGGSGSMIGIYQINAKVHAAYAKSLGMDIYTLNGNLTYARYLYEQEGTSPWMSSFGCWGKVSPAAEATSSSDTNASSPLVSTLVLGVVSSEVLMLQKMLNVAGFLVATEGPGSPGQETSKFGGATRAAVRKFQCSKQVACAGDEYSTGYGVVGAKTRAALTFAAREKNNVAQTSATISIAVENSDPAIAEQIAHLRAVIAALTEQILGMQRERGIAKSI